MINFCRNFLISNFLNKKCLILQNCVKGKSLKITWKNPLSMIWFVQEYELPPKAEEEENGKGELKGEEERNEVQHEADSTTPIRLVRDVFINSRTNLF